jgi:hypothetical protein
LWEEFETIHGIGRTPTVRHGPDASLLGYYDAALQHEQAALCLSGGGIRSAAFSLGVIQSLAQRGLLTDFHYLSIVSGGGYIGGWLTALLHAHEGNDAEVQAALGAAVAPPELHRLRSYTNFLTPSPGISSPDTWAGILLWVRNVLVNWLIFGPALFALALLPGLYADFLATIGPRLSWPLLVIGLLCLFVGTYSGAAHLPSHARQFSGWPGPRAGFVPLRVVLPLVLWAALVPLVAAPWLRPMMPEGAIAGDVIPPLGFIVMEMAYVCATLRASEDDRRLFRHNFGWWSVASLVAAFILWLELDLAIALAVTYVTVLGPLAVTLSFLVQSLIYVALRTEAFRGDLDREWLARLNAEKVVPTLLWGIFAAVCLLLPRLVLDQWGSRFMPFLVSAFGLLTGPLAAYIGKISGDMGDPDPSKSTGRFTPSSNVVLSVVAAVFAATLFMLLARLGAHFAVGGIVSDLVLLAFSALLAWALGRHINVNRFSLHAMYRSRLVRAFLGSARRTRTPDDFTGIDPHDNPRMADLIARPAGKRRLFPVVNITLNLTAERNNAWAERKGESFTVTACRCGAAYLHKCEDIAAGLPARGAYARTAHYAGAERETGPHDQGHGITLGTALALSGAAASPNMGYHSSPGAAFLMTLFNVRLGAWLPNPASAATEQLQQAKPPNALLTLARELLGLSDDLGDAVYLSDGGHFENLGLYEMVRRRCRRILVVDAGADPGANFEDLGNAIRKIRIDLDVEIEFEPPVAIGSRDKPLLPFRSFAYAKIHYRESATPGELVYVKPADLPAMSMDVRAYRNLNVTFPHQSTLDQFFGESQFESYRQLGRSEAALLAPSATTLTALFDGVRHQAPEPPIPDPLSPTHQPATASTAEVEG